MTFPRFFIDRPIFAIVLSVLMMIGGIVSFFQLPLSEYPAVTPPTVQVTTAYPGANPDVIAQTVATPLEQAITGVEGMLYMSSQSATDGRMILTITFDQHIDPDMAQIQVQNRVSRVLSRLPDEVQRQGVVTQKTSPDILMVVHLLSPEQRYDPLYISNYAYLQVRDELLRLPGISDVVVWGAGEYSMRLWLDPDLIAARGLTAGEVIAAVREQNVQVAAGAVGQAPDSNAAFQVTVNTLGRLSDEEQFGDIIVRTGADGQVTRLRDVARIEMGGDAYALRSLLDGEPAVALQIIQSPGANALDTAEAVRATVARLEGNFPAGLSARIAYDPTVFVRASLQTVATTLLEAILLVVVVVVLFLRSWRASLIPLMAVPVSLVGTFAVMHLMGFSLNTLSLFGLVLSIGIVVDDAIVVVENVERHIENGEPPLQAARRAMDEVTGPIMAITSVLAAVFIPTAFLSGLQGEFYRQFALTIAISTILSALNSLTLSPALAGLLLRPRPAGGAVAGRFQRLLQVLGRPLRNAPEAYGNAVRKVVRVSGLALVVYGGLLGLTWVGFQAVPPGFVPMQDKYYLVGIAQLPNGASLERTDAVVRQMSRIGLDEPGVESVVAFPGLSVNGFVNVPNAAVMFFMLDPFESRTSADLGALDASWEIDLFGRVRRSVEAAEAQAGSREALLRNVQASVAATVAMTWFQLQGIEAELAVVHDIAGNQRDSLEMVERLVSAGSAHEFDRLRAEALLHNVEAAVPDLERRRAATRNALAVLLAEAPQAFSPPVARASGERLTLRTLGVGDPAGLLARRADIAAAERNLAAATARIGVETAGLYPRVEVRGSIGLVAGNLDALDESGTSFNVLNPVIRWALLDRGRVRARIAASEARAQEALILYDRTVLRALQETDDAFNGYGAAADRLRLRLLEATANREAARLARERFVQGDGEYLDVLEAERSDYLSRRALSIARTEQRLAVVGIYKALGGGWEACAGARRCGVATDDTSPGVARQRDSRS